MYFFLFFGAGGAYSNPLDEGLLVFNDKAAAEAFAKTDPYVINKLVSSYKIREVSSLSNICISACLFAGMYTCM